MAPTSEAIVTMWPRLRRTIAGKKALVHQNSASTFTSIVRSIASSGRSNNRRPLTTPALRMSTSMSGVRAASA